MACGNYYPVGIKDPELVPETVLEALLPHLPTGIPLSYGLCGQLHLGSTTKFHP